MFIDLSKLPPGFKVELTKEDLIAFADHLLNQRYKNGNGSNPDDEEPIDVAAVADLLNVSKQHVYFLTSNKKIPHFKRGKRCHFFKSLVLQWLREGKTMTEEEIDNLANEYINKSMK